ncbi:MAG TPA: polymer-forming cytoskeletal protein [Thermomicrobiales bacterium]|nr:polymer-forming cytoskeletal protein [Thermomicrobiales bacterium]
MSFTSTAGSATMDRSATGMTIIDANTVIDGTLSTSHDLRIDGHVTGTVMCDGVLHVTEGAEVDATVEAAGIVVAGSLSGAITCHGRLEIRSTGMVRGRVETGRLIVVEGAVYEGQLRMDAEQVEPTPLTPLPTQVAEAEPEAAAPGQATGSYSFLRSFTPGSTPAREDDDDLPASPGDEDPE